MATIAKFFHMGGYAFYVWSAYALAAIVLVLNVVGPIRRERELRRELGRLSRTRRGERA